MIVGLFRTPGLRYLEDPDLLHKNAEDPGLRAYAQTPASGAVNFRSIRR
jgi:hypothetical protein